ncbi:hypothetical protein D9613_003478 [Agrocybe pediades]|uniref:DUF6593 domain-containing protein n=1 Tax=Agrocybe pediades TaxID=84607 RepID=A0A8H4QQS7_9AGAR|nr:hypothetical protein D9613_003478 [Agrocybe pediades]
MLDRLFSGEDGMTYIWRLEKNVSEVSTPVSPSPPYTLNTTCFPGKQLFLLDSDPHEKHGKAHVPLLVARYAHPSETTEQHPEKKEKTSYQPNQKQAPTCINIFPAGEHIVDLIILTFLYIERLRIQRISHHQSPHNKGNNNHTIDKQGLKNGTNSRRQSPMINIA